jgi:hypothetical protein
VSGEIGQVHEPQRLADETREVERRVEEHAYRRIDVARHRM